MQENEQRVYGKIEETYNKCAYRKRHRCKWEKLDSEKGRIYEETETMQALL